MGFIAYKILMVLIIAGCSNSKEGEQTTTSKTQLFEYENYQDFKNWTISPRDNEITVFDYSKLDTTYRLLVKQLSGEYLVFNSGFGNTPRSDSYVEYYQLSDSIKEILPIIVVDGYFSLGFNRISYREDDHNSFLIISSEKEAYWYFYNLDTANPPNLFENFKEIGDNWYHRAEE